MNAFNQSIFCQHQHSALCITAKRSTVFHTPGLLTGTAVAIMQYTRTNVHDYYNGCLGGAAVRRRTRDR